MTGNQELESLATRPMWLTFLSHTTLVVAGCSAEVPPPSESALERSACATIDDVVRHWPAAEIDRTAEKWTRGQTSDGGERLAYDHAATPMVHYAISSFRTVAAAREEYSFQAGKKQTPTSDDVRVETRNDFFAWGEESDCKFYVVAGRREALNLWCRQGRTVVNFVIFGLVHEDGSKLQQILTPKLSRAAAPR